MQMGDVPATWADATLLQDLTGYCPQTDFRDGIVDRGEFPVRPADRGGGRGRTRRCRPALDHRRIVANLALLGVFKYADFFIETAAALGGAPLSALGLILPIGISFFTFQQIAYLMDVRAGRSSATGSSITRFSSVSFHN